VTTLRRLAGLAAFALSIAGLGAPAAAQWEVCNHTSYITQVATSTTDDGLVRTEGWFRVRPGECAIVRDEPLAPGPIALYAQSARAHLGGTRQWAGGIARCVDAANQTFLFSGERPCEELGPGVEERLFIAAEATGPTWRTTLEEPDRHDARKARQAGIQRLLQDAGYDVPVIDGFGGRRTVLETRRFVEDRGLSNTIEEPDLIDALEAAAVERGRDLGLTVCNQTSAEVWTAHATMREDGWESRGWWSLPANGCARLLSTGLAGRDHYLFAALESPDGERRLTSGVEPFCLADTRFAIIGRDDCARRGYTVGRFVRLDTRGRSVLEVTLSEDDFAGVVQALRR
jgi:uncharacterized membrane protein